MSVDQELYLNDPQYQQALVAFQSGSWESGITELQQLTERYPLSNSLRALDQEMRLRARVDQDEAEDNRILRKRQARKWAVRSVVLVILLAVAYYGFSTYSTWLQSQVIAAQQRLEREMRTLELSVKFRDAQNLAQVGRLTDAQVIYQQIAGLDPEFPGLEEALNRTETLIAVEEEYEDAIRTMDQGNLSDALSAFEGIQAREPYYKDVSIRISEIKSRFFLGDVLSKADQAYEDQDWVTAAAQYETLRALDVTYKPEEIDERLFNCYMNAAIQSLSEDDSLEALEIAEIYFRKALTLRPQDPVIQLEREQARQSFKDRLFSSYVDVALTAVSESADSLEALATAESYFQRALELRPDDPEIGRQRQLAALFLNAQADFSSVRWTDAIVKLEELYLLDPNYANGTGLQLLYDAYMARGDTQLQSTDYEAALTDFQRAAVLAQETEKSNIRVFQAQAKIAEIQGILGDYQTASSIYSQAIDQADFSAEALAERPDLRTKIQQADANAQGRFYRAAYRLYRDAARTIVFLFPTTEYVVATGDYLAQIANRYNTTVQAILQANNLNFSSEIAPGKALVIPVLEP